MTDKKPKIVEKPCTKENLLHQALASGEDGSVVHVAEETVYGYMGGWEMQYVTYEPGWYWTTWEDGGGPCPSKEAAIDAAKESIESWERYCDNEWHAWMHSY